MAVVLVCVLYYIGICGGADVKEMWRVLENTELERLSDSGRCRPGVSTPTHPHTLTRSHRHPTHRKFCRNCPHMEKLVLSKCVRISDQSTECLSKNCPNLLHLNLSSCRAVTDDSCRHLRSVCVCVCAYVRT